jgi:hypothetical protein
MSFPSRRTSHLKDTILRCLCSVCLRPYLCEFLLPYSLCVVRLAGPTVRIELEETACWSLDWANSETIAVGTTSGDCVSCSKEPALTVVAMTWRINRHNRCVQHRRSASRSRARISVCGSCDWYPSNSLHRCTPISDSCPCLDTRPTLFL